MREYLLCAFAAATVTYLATAAVRRLAIRIGAVAAVRDRDVHSTPTPRMRWTGLGKYQKRLTKPPTRIQKRLGRGGTKT